MTARSVSSSRSPSSVQPAGASSLLLRRALIADALITGVTGALMLAGAGPLHDWLDLPTALLRWAGLFLIGYAGLVARIGTRPTINRGAVKGVITANLAWAVGCLVLLPSHPRLTMSRMKSGTLNTSRISSLGSAS